jgi:hypothetical protein
MDLVQLKRDEWAVRFLEKTSRGFSTPASVKTQVLLGILDHL